MAAPVAPTGAAMGGAGGGGVGGGGGGGGRAAGGGRGCAGALPAGAGAAGSGGGRGRRVACPEDGRPAALPGAPGPREGRWRGVGERSGGRLYSLRASGLRGPPVRACGKGGLTEAGLGEGTAHARAGAPRFAGPASAFRLFARRPGAFARCAPTL